MNKHIEPHQDKIETKLIEVYKLQEELRELPEGESHYIRRMELHEKISEGMREIGEDCRSLYQQGVEDGKASEQKFITELPDTEPKPYHGITNEEPI